MRKLVCMQQPRTGWVTILQMVGRCLLVHTPHHSVLGWGNFRWAFPKK